MFVQKIQTTLSNVCPSSLMLPKTKQSPPPSRNSLSYQKKRHGTLDYSKLQYGVSYGTLVWKIRYHDVDMCPPRCSKDQAAYNMGGSGVSIEKSPCRRPGSVSRNRMETRSCVFSSVLPKKKQLPLPTQRIPQTSHGAPGLSERRGCNQLWKGCLENATLWFTYLSALSLSKTTQPPSTKLVPTH